MTAKDFDDGMDEWETGVWPVAYANCENTGDMTSGLYLGGKAARTRAESTPRYSDWNPPCAAAGIAPAGIGCIAALPLSEPAALAPTMCHPNPRENRAPYSKHRSADHSRTADDRRAPGPVRLGVCCGRVGFQGCAQNVLTACLRGVIAAVEMTVYLRKHLYSFGGGGGI